MQVQKPTFVRVSFLRNRTHKTDAASVQAGSAGTHVAA